MSSCRFHGNQQVAGIKAAGIAVLSFAERYSLCQTFEAVLERFKFRDIAMSKCNVGWSCCMEALDVPFNVEGSAVYSLKWSLYYTP